MTLFAYAIVNGSFFLFVLSVALLSFALVLIVVAIGQYQPKIEVQYQQEWEDEQRVKMELIRECIIDILDTPAIKNQLIDIMRYREARVSFYDPISLIDITPNKNRGDDEHGKEDKEGTAS